MMTREIEITLAVGDYHRTRPLLDGKVSMEGVQLKVFPVPPGDACLRPLYEELDVAEMELSWYVTARSRKEPLIGLPIFPLRMFV
jgi:4,5-dihydroxyphthalate decarboxylase